MHLDVLGGDFNWKATDGVAPIIADEESIFEVPLGFAG